MKKIYRNLGHFMCAGFTLMFLYAQFMDLSGGLQLLLLGMIALSIFTQIMVTLELILERLELNSKERT